MDRNPYFCAKTGVKSQRRDHSRVRVPVNVLEHKREFPHQASDVFIVLYWHTYWYYGWVECERLLQSDQGDVVVAVQAVRVVEFGVNMDGYRQHRRLQEGFNVSVTHVDLQTSESVSEHQHTQCEGPRRLSHLDGVVWLGTQFVSCSQNPALCDHHTPESYASYIQ